MQQQVVMQRVRAAFHARLLAGRFESQVAVAKRVTELTAEPLVEVLANHQAPGPLRREPHLGGSRGAGDARVPIDSRAARASDLPILRQATIRKNQEKSE